MPLAGLLLVLPGCKPQATTDRATPADGSTTIPQTPSERAVEITLRTADGAAFQELLKSKRGRVVLVDCWATWCVPCRQQFPHTVELHRELSPRGVAVVSVSFDDPNDEAARADVQGFLKQQGAAFDNLVSWQGAAETAFEAFGIENGALPHYQLYDRQGKLVRKFNSGDPHNKPFTPDDIRQAIEQLLAAPDAPPE